MSLVSFFVLTVAFAAVFLIGRWALIRYLQFRGKRLIVCPDNRRTEAVELDSTHAFVTSTAGRPELRLRDCSRWPEKADCGQDCIEQIEQSPGGCLVANIIRSWYSDKACTFCGRDLSNIDWTEHKPVLLRPDGTTIEWRHVRAETIPEVITTHKPVCWTCHVAEEFRRRYPDLVTDRQPPPRPERAPS